MTQSEFIRYQKTKHYLKKEIKKSLWILVKQMMRAKNDIECLEIDVSTLALYLWSTKLDRKSQKLVTMSDAKKIITEDFLVVIEKKFKDRINKKLKPFEEVDLAVFRSGEKVAMLYGNTELVSMEMTSSNVLSKFETLENCIKEAKDMIDEYVDQFDYSVPDGNG